jgi:hypothetical protein
MKQKCMADVQHWRRKLVICRICSFEKWMTSEGLGEYAETGKR